MLFATAVTLLAAAAHAQTGGDITYGVNLTAGGGTVVGEITTNGALGVLGTANIVNWNLTLTSGPETENLTSAGNQSLFGVLGSDLTATSATLVFNYSGTDQGAFYFEASNPGRYSGYHYWCNNTTWYACASGFSIVPGAYNDAYALYVPETGSMVLGTAQANTLGSVIQSSIRVLANSRIAQALLAQLQSQLLVGLDEQISCGNCGGANINFGSEAIAGHGRYLVAPDWTLLGGAQIGRYSQGDAAVGLSEGMSASLQYDPSELGNSRPFFELGGAATLQNATYRRTYDAGSGAIASAGAARDYEYNASIEGGWVLRATPRDEAAAYVTYARLWQLVGTYAENSGNPNALNAAVRRGTDTLDTLGLQIQYTHLFGRYLEADINGGARWALNAHSGLVANVAGQPFYGNQSRFTYYNGGGRLGIRVQRHLTVDLYVNGIVAPQSIGSSVHGGFGARWVY